MNGRKGGWAELLPREHFSATNPNIAATAGGRRVDRSKDMSAMFFFMAATHDIKLLGSVRGEAMQRQKNDCIWQQSRLFFKCSEWIPSSATSGYQDVSKIVFCA